MAIPIASVFGPAASALTITRIHNRLMQPALAVAQAQAPPAPSYLASALTKVDRALEQMAFGTVAVVVQGHSRVAAIQACEGIEVLVNAEAIACNVNIC